MALASLVFNLGDEAAAELIFKELGCPLNELVAEKLRLVADHSSRNKAYWRTKKCQLQNAKHRRQEQFQTKSTSRKNYEATYIPAKVQLQLEMSQEVEKVEKMWLEKSSKNDKKSGSKDQVSYYISKDKTSFLSSFCSIQILLLVTDESKESACVCMCGRAPSAVRKIA